MSKVAPSPDLHGDEPVAATREARADRRELAFIAVERTRMPMVVTDARQADHPIVLANEAFLQLSGYSAQQVLGRNCRFLQGEATSSAAVTELRAAVAEEREANVEILNYRKNGEPFWNQVYLSPIHDDAGRLLYTFGSQQDVSAQRRAERLETVERRLLREVNHRTLNTLTIVESIVRLSRADDAPAYAASVQRRVRAITQAHTMLSEGGWAETSLEALICDQVKTYGRRRTNVAGPAVEIPADAVQPLALVFHELIANAATHGALAARTGSVSINWTAGDDDTLALQWRESGSSPPAAPSPGFGWTMIRLIIERQLRGEVRQTWREDGLDIVLIFSRTRRGSRGR